MKKLELIFENAEGKIVKYTVDKPVEPVNGSTVNEVMDTVISQNALSSTGGDIVSKRGARIVETTIEEIELG